MEFECENLTTVGCERMDSVKELMLLEQIESDIELDLNNIANDNAAKTAITNAVMNVAR